MTIIFSKNLPFLSRKFSRTVICDIITQTTLIGKGSATVGTIK